MHAGLLHHAFVAVSNTNRSAEQNTSHQYPQRAHAATLGSVGRWMHQSRITESVVLRASEVHNAPFHTSGEPSPIEDFALKSPRPVPDARYLSPPISTEVRNVPALCVGRLASADSASMLSMPNGPTQAAYPHHQPRPTGPARAAVKTPAGPRGGFP